MAGPNPLLDSRKRLPSMVPQSRTRSAHSIIHGGLVLPVRNVMVFGTIETDAKWFSAASFRFAEQTRTRQRQISQNRTPKSQES